MAVPAIIQYTNLLHKHRDRNAKEIVDFVSLYKQDHVFMARARVLDKLYGLKEQLVTLPASKIRKSAGTTIVVDGVDYELGTGKVEKTRRYAGQGHVRATKALGITRKELSKIKVAAPEG